MKIKEMSKEDIELLSYDDLKDLVIIDDEEDVDSL